MSDAAALPMSEPPAPLVRLVQALDGFAKATASLTSLLVIPLMLAMVYEVSARYLFNAPTIWAYDVSYMLYGTHFMLGTAYALLRGAHIRTDIFYQYWSERRKGIIDSLLYLLFFFPGMIFYFWMGMQEFLQSWDIGERSDLSPWQPVIWPFKGMIPLAILLLMIQGVSEFAKSAYAAVTGRALQ